MLLTSLSLSPPVLYGVLEQIWPHIERLDAEVLTEEVHPLFRKAVYSGLRRPIINE